MNQSSSALRILQVIRDGGGTPGVELRVAEKLRAAGHHVRVAGSPEVGAVIERAGFAYLRLLWPKSGERYGDRPLILQQLDAAETWARALAGLAEPDTDVIITDSAVFAGALAAQLVGLPSVSLMPTVYVADEFTTGPAAALVEPANRIRASLRLAPVATFADQFLDVDRMLMLTARELEPPDVAPPAHVRYVGPQLPPADAGSVDALIPPGPEPLVIVGLSTSEQDQRTLLRRIVHVLHDAEVRAVVTVGPAVDPAEIPGSDRLVVCRTAPHGPLMARADVVITHAGHGTVAAALRAGVPLLCLPMGRDQPAVAARVARHGAGIVLDPAVADDLIAGALRQLLTEPDFAAAAGRLARAIAGYPDELVVREIEAVAAGRRLITRPW